MSKPATVKKASKGNAFSIICKVLLHLLGFPLLGVLVFLLDRNIIKGGIAYGTFVFVGLIVVAAMAVVYYLTYFLVRLKKKRSIRNQTIIVAIVVMLCLSGFWMMVDGLLPDAIEGVTQSTIRWEDISDNWEARGDVNHQLLVDYVTINYENGRLTGENGATIDDYVRQGPNNEELAALFADDFASIDGDGYGSFKGPSVDYAQDDRMTIPVLVHLFLDDRSAAQGVNNPNYEKELPMLMPYYYNPSITKSKLGETDGDGNAIAANAFALRVYTGYDKVRVSATKTSHMRAFIVTDDSLNHIVSVSSINIVMVENGKYCAKHYDRKVSDGKEELKLDEEKYAEFGTQEEAVAYLQEQYSCGDNYYVRAYRKQSVNWHVLDMSGEGMQIDLSGVLSEDLMETPIPVLTSLGTVGDILNGDLVSDSFVLVADMLSEPEMLGSPLYLSLDTQSGELDIQPSNTQRGVLGYMQMAWLNQNGSLYMLTSLFSVRTIFYIWGPVMMLITVLLGVVREYERKRKTAAVAVAEEGAEFAQAQDAQAEEFVLDDIELDAGEGEADFDADASGEQKDAEQAQIAPQEDADVVDIDLVEPAEEGADPAQAAKEE